MKNLAVYLMLAAFVWSADAEELLFKMRMTVGIETNEAGVVSVIARMALENQTVDTLQLGLPGWVRFVVLSSTGKQISPVRTDSDDYMVPGPRLGFTYIRPKNSWRAETDLSPRFALTGPGQYIVFATWRTTVEKQGTNSFEPPLRVEAISENILVDIPATAIRPPAEPLVELSPDEKLRRGTQPIPEDATPETRAFIERSNHSLTNMVLAEKAYFARFQTQEVVTAKPDTNVMAPPEPAPPSPPVTVAAAPSSSRWLLVVIAGLAVITAAFVLLRRKRG